MISRCRRGDVPACCHHRYPNAVTGRVWVSSLSLSTGGTHLGRIYAKPCAGDRFVAVRRARERQLSISGLEGGALGSRAGWNQLFHGCPRKLCSAVLWSRESASPGDAPPPACGGVSH